MKVIVLRNIVSLRLCHNHFFIWRNYAVGHKRNSQGDFIGGSKKAATKKPDLSPAYGNFSFIEYSLTKEDKDKLQLLIADGKIDEWLVFDVVESGYKFSLNCDKKSGAYLAAFSCNTADAPNYGLILTGRGRTAASATIALLYRHIHLCPNGEWAALSGSDNIELFE